MTKQDLYDKLEWFKKPEQPLVMTVYYYAYDLLEDIDDPLPENLTLFKKALLNGADDWYHYSFSGCSLCYDSDIEERLQVPKDLYDSEDLLRIQAKNLETAAKTLEWVYKIVAKEA